MKEIRTDFLIVGNSAAGISAAEAIRSQLPQAAILIVGDEPYPAYGRPLISYMIEGKTSENNIWLRDDDYYEKNKFDTLFGSEYEVVELRPSDHKAVLANEDTIVYSKCLLATGSIPFTPPIEGLEGADNVFSFMKLDDAKALWDASKALKLKRIEDEIDGEAYVPVRILVVGAGLIGLKAAEAMTGEYDEILVLELAPRILPAVLDAQGADILQKILSDHQIACMPGVSAQRFIRDGSHIVGAELTDGTKVDCDIVVAAVGVRPNSALAVNAGAVAERGLVCDRHLQTTLEDVYAAGDVVQVTDVLDGSKHPLALWPNAIQQGRFAGRCMADPLYDEAYEGSFAINSVDFFEASLLTSGTINPPEEDVNEGIYEQKIYSDDTAYAKFVIKDNKLVGYILLNRPENAGIYTSLIENSIPLDSVDEKIFEKPPENLDFSRNQRWERLHRGYPNTLDNTGACKEVV